MPRRKQYIEEEVLDKAMHQFWKNGYEGTSVRVLEKAMGINQFTMYARYKTKNDLLIASLIHYQQKVYSSLLVKLAKSEGGLPAIKLFFHRFIEFVKVEHKETGCLLTNTMLEVGHKNKKVEIIISTFVNQVREIFTSALIKSIERGDMSESIQLNKYVNFLMGLLQGLAASTRFFNEKQLNDYIEIAFKQLN